MTCAFREAWGTSALSSPVTSSTSSGIVSGGHYGRGRVCNARCSSMRSSISSERAGQTLAHNNDAHYRGMYRWWYSTISVGFDMTLGGSR